MDMLSGKQITAANRPRRRRCQDVSDNRRSEHVRPSLYQSLGGRIASQGATINYWFPIQR